MSSIRSSGGRAETLLGKTMWSLGLRYRKQYSATGKPDYVLVKAKIAVFCDGDFWHGRDLEERLSKGRFSSNRDYWEAKIRRNIGRDQKVTSTLEEQGWLVLRFWESQILTDPLSCADAVLEAFLRRTHRGSPRND